MPCVQVFISLSQHFHVCAIRTKTLLETQLCILNKGTFIKYLALRSLVMVTIPPTNGCNASKHNQKHVGIQSYNIW